MLKIRNKTVKGYKFIIMEGVLSCDEIDDLYNFFPGNAPYNIKKELLEEMAYTIDDIILKQKEERACTRFVIIEKVGYLTKYREPNKSWIEDNLNKVKIL